MQFGSIRVMLVGHHVSNLKLAFMEQDTCGVALGAWLEGEAAFSCMSRLTMALKSLPSWKR